MIRPSFSAALFIAVAALAACAVPTDASACGGFFAPSRMVAKPSLALERVLLVHDAAEGRQHFIRQVTFRASREVFGFVVPTPSRPEVDKVEGAPFDALHSEFPFHAPRVRGGRLPRVRMGGGTGGGPGVSVLDVRKVGSFTAFVLAAQDEKALAKWLADNRLVSTPEADKWLAHYVRMGFFYVAMRYDPPKEKNDEDKDRVLAETVRISFDTPLPYYPYLEPDRPAGTATKERALELWLVSTAPSRPVALHQSGEQRRWVRPLRAGQRHDDARSKLKDALGEKLMEFLPEGELTVQTFQDQKRSRQGYGDVLFVPHTYRPLGDAERRALRPLLGIVDPSLVESRPE